MRKLLGLAGAVCLSSSLMHAAVTIEMQADALRTSGEIAAPTSTLVLLVADTSQNGFGQILSGQTLSVNSILGGSDDRIVGIFDMSLNATAGYFGGSLQGVDLSTITGWGAGDGLALVWFPTLTLSSTGTTTDVGTSYGIFSGPPASGDPWVTPDSGTLFLDFFNQGGVVTPGTLPAASGNASNTVTAVPEPSVSVLAMAGAMFAVLGRRRRRNRHP
jgi:uncharacterized protein (TIGR03382 family)